MIAALHSLTFLHYLKSTKFVLIRLFVVDKSKKTSKIQQLNRKDMFMVKSKIFLFFLLCVGTMNLNAESPHSFGIGGLNTSVDSQDLSSGGLVYEYKTDNVAL